MNDPDSATARCPWSDEVLAHLLHEPAVRDPAEVEAHVAGCAACTKLRRDFAHVAGALRAIPPPPAPDLADAVVARTCGDRRRGFWVPLALAAGLMLAFALWQMRPPHAEPNVAAAQPAAPARAEAALSRAVDWLIAAQDEQGAWSAARWGAQSNYTVGVTALGLLAILASEPAATNPAPAAVARAVGYLLRQQDGDGLFGPNRTGALYNHALACLALMDAGARHPDQLEMRRLDKSLALLARAQLADGGWSYLRAPSTQANASLTAWALLALSRAEELKIRPHDEAVPRGLAWLDAAVDDESRAALRRAGESPRGSEALTAAAAVCMLGGPSAKGARLHAVLDQVRSDVAQAKGIPDFYRCFFQAVALREAGFQDSVELARMEDRLFTLQEQEGEAAGSWPALDQWSRAGGRVYTTAMAVLALRDR